MSKARRRFRARSAKANFTPARKSSGSSKIYLQLEQLEDRTLPSTGQTIGDAIGLSFADISPSIQTVHVSNYLARPNDVEIYRFTLNPGDMVTALVNTAPYGGALNSRLRVFQETDNGGVRQIASNDDFQGRDAGLTFQAPAAGVYDLGVSSFDNTAYNPIASGSGVGSSKGLFDLIVSKTAAVPESNLVAASFRVSQAAGVWGDSFTVNYTVENRGELGTTATNVSLVASADNRFDDGIPALQSATIPALAGGDSYSGSFTIQLGDAETPLAPFAVSQQIFLGLKIGIVNPQSPEHGNDWASLEMLALDTIDTDPAIAINSRTNDRTLAPGAEYLYTLVVPASGNLHVWIDAAGSPASLSLYDARHLPIVQSDGQSTNNPDPSITQGVTGGMTYYLKVVNQGTATITYRLTNELTLSDSTLTAVPVTSNDIAIVTGDFNGDGIPDIITANTSNPDGSAANDLTVLLGNGDGTFQRAGTIDLGGITPSAITSGDFNGDGRIDLAVASHGAVQILLGNGDGTFQSPQIIPNISGDSVVAGEFSGDGRIDLAVGDSVSNSVSILLNDGDGTFDISQSLSLPDPTAIAAGDFNGDGRTDLTVADGATNQVTLLRNVGGGLFLVGGAFDVGTFPGALAVGDFNGDGRLDIAVANQVSNNVSVLLGNGDGSFTPGTTYAVGSRPTSIVTGDFNGDGRLDIACANYFSNNATVLLGTGDGAFQDVGPVAVGTNPRSLSAADFDGDGDVDLAAGDYFSDDVAVLLGNGSGTFPVIASPNSTDQYPIAMVSGDFNGDGRLDLAVANRGSNTVTILLGQGDGTFQSAGEFAAGLSPFALVAGDFNGDGRLDLAIADYGYGHSDPGVSILLGNGDGTFETGGTYNVGGKASAIVAGDFTSDGNLDLAVAVKFNSDDSPGNTVALLVGNGHGAFSWGGATQAGVEPDALVAGDFADNGQLDLAVADYSSRDVTLLRGNGHGNFSQAGNYNVGGAAIALAAGNFTQDGRTDLAVATKNPNAVTILLNTGGGSFVTGDSYPVDTVMSSLTAGVFVGDGPFDLIATNLLNYSDYSPADSLTIFLGHGDGTFQNAGSIPAGSEPFAAVAGDFNGDRRLDLAVADYGSASVAVFLGGGTGSFFATVLAPNPIQSTPLVANFTGGSTLGAVNLTESGQILYRRGLASQPGTFAPPVTINPSSSLAACDLALVDTAGGGILLAALDAGTFAVSNDPSALQVPRVTLYQPHADGTFTILFSLDLPAGFLPANIASADLTGDGLGDLVITAAASDQVFVAMQTSPGVFGPVIAYAVGVNPSAIDLADVNGDGLPDITVTDRYSGQLSVLVNQGNGVFAPEERFAAGVGFYGLAPVNNSLAVQSLLDTNGIVSVGSNVVVTNSGSDSFIVLPADGRGGFLNPQSSQVTSIGSTATAIVTGDFNGDGYGDLAILSKDSDTISIYGGEGNGSFLKIATVNAGNQPTGLAVADVSQPGGGGPDGIEDLLVGNAFGDLLVLAGNGDGTFAQYRRANASVGLAVAASATTGQNTFFFSDQAHDQLAFKSAAVGTSHGCGAGDFPRSQCRSRGARSRTSRQCSRHTIFGRRQQWRKPAVDLHARRRWPADCRERANIFHRDRPHQSYGDRPAK